jgi:hypothetical protein
MGLTVRKYHERFCIFELIYPKYPRVSNEGEIEMYPQKLDTPYH